MHSDERTHHWDHLMRRIFSLRYRLLPLLFMLAAATLLSSCKIGGGGDDDGDGQARFRLLNASTGYTSLDVYSNDQDDDDDDDVQRFSAVSYGAISDYVSLKAATYTLDFRRAGASTSLLGVSSQAMAEDTNATYVAYGSTGHFQVYKINDDQTEADSGKANVTVVNAVKGMAVVRGEARHHARMLQPRTPRRHGHGYGTRRSPTPRTEVRG